MSNFQPPPSGEPDPRPRITPHRAIELLRELGLNASEAHASSDLHGFPVLLHVGNASIVLDMAEPSVLANMDPEHVGIAVIDALGYTRRSWGLAKRLKFFKPQESALLSEIGPLIQGAYQGENATVFFDGYRYHVAAMEADGPPVAVVLVTHAGEEKTAKRQAHLFSREAEALKKIGRALNMNQSLVPLCYAAVHEIASVGELASVLLWTVNKEDMTLELAASTGANRSGTSALAKLNAWGGSSCVAELVASSRQPFFLPSVNGHVITSDLEGRFCYLKPGGLSAWPLVTGGNLIGVLELVGREGDEHFEAHLELFQTIAEHLALALNSSILFESFERLASHDSLTGIANHRTMHEFLNLRLAESQRTNAEIGVIMIDVDHFRSFNEEEGHETGDQVLKLVAETIKGVVRPYDLAARYGGEEFTVILPGSGRESTFTIADRIRKKVEAVPFETRTGRQRHVTVSIGFSVFPHTATDAGALLRSADAALYEAKKQGRNRVIFYEGKFVETDDEGMSLEALWNWLPEEQRPLIRARLDRLESHIDLVAKALRLSRNQSQILKALVVVETTYRTAAAKNDRTKLKALAKLNEHRVLEPSLIALNERYDGAGPQGLAGSRIPLLTRVLDALLAFEMDGGKSFATDPGRFDPEIVSMVAELEDAA